VQSLHGLGLGVGLRSSTRRSNAPLQYTAPTRSFDFPLYCGNADAAIGATGAAAPTTA
jgi:hypothetical protein